VTPRGDHEGVATVIAESGAWTPIHLVIIAGIVLMYVGVVILAQTMRERTPMLSRFVWPAATAGAVLGLLTLALDGVAAKQLADAWAASTSKSVADVALVAVNANETVNFTLAGLFNMTFAGYPFLLLGVAIVLGGHYRGWLGWIAIVAGAFSVTAGMFQLVTGVPTTTSLVLTVIGPSIITLWLAIMGVVMWPRQGDETNRRAGP
ncbi:MAG TPA: hypothetical protein VIQ30_04400, partial [Pseudonocardia sp.]